MVSLVWGECDVLYAYSLGLSILFCFLGVSLSTPTAPVRTVHGITVAECHSLPVDQPEFPGHQHWCARLLVGDAVCLARLLGRFVCWDFLSLSLSRIQALLSYTVGV
jgi:hypothetical protein